jgi:hypothetical protein
LSRAHLHGRIHHLQPTLYYGICRNMSSSIFWLYGMVKPLPIMLGKGARWAPSGWGRPPNIIGRC